MPVTLFFRTQSGVGFIAALATVCMFGVIGAGFYYFTSVRIQASAQIAPTQEAHAEQKTLAINEANMYAHWELYYDKALKNLHGTLRSMDKKLIATRVDYKKKAIETTGLHEKMRSFQKLIDIFSAEYKEQVATSKGPKDPAAYTAFNGKEYTEVSGKEQLRAWIGQKNELVVGIERNEKMTASLSDILTRFVEARGKLKRRLQQMEDDKVELRARVEINNVETLMASLQLLADADANVTNSTNTDIQNLNTLLTIIDDRVLTDETRRSLAEEDGDSSAAMRSLNQFLNEHDSSSTSSSPTSSRKIDAELDALLQ